MFFFKKIKNIIKSLITESLENSIKSNFNESLIKLQQSFLNLNESQVNKKDWEYVMVLLGQLHIERIKKIKEIKSLKEVEFKVFSQFGEDGILQYLINNIEIPNKIFIEFGVSNYLESNTRFLLMNDNWQGLILDGSQENINAIKNDRLYYRHQLTALNSFITKDNINEIIKSNINTEDIGLLNIDIDGNDYWIWNEINVIKPRIVVCEFNSLFGNKYPITIPYQSDFNVVRAHYSCQYFGASLPALCKLADEKGYDFIGCDSEGVDSFFVRKDLLHSIRKLNVKEGYVSNKYRISRDINGNLNYLNKKDCLNNIQDMNVLNIETNKLLKIKDLDFSDL